MPDYDISFQTGEDQTGSQFKFVQQVASVDNFVEIAQSNSTLILGIQQDVPTDTTSNLAVRVTTALVVPSKLVIGDDVDAGTELASDNVGRGRTASSTELCAAVALEDGTSLGVINVLTTRYNVN